MVGAAADVLFRGARPLPIQLWDGSVIEGNAGSEVVHLTSPNVLAELFWAPSELGLARSFVKGYIDIEGDLPTALRKMRSTRKWTGGDFKRTGMASVRLASAVRPLLIGLMLKRPEPPAEEIHLGGRRHSRRRDASAIAHHYDAGNKFYALMLGGSMTYTCADFRGASTLDAAQINKLDLVAEKLELGRSGVDRLLDVGCGWGSMAIRAAEQFGASVTAITNSAAQAEWVSERVEAAGLSQLIDLQEIDYRDLSSGLVFDAISSIGMSEAVGREHLASYFAKLASHLRPGGRLLNHAISGQWTRPGTRSFTQRYIFPDGDVVGVGATIGHMEAAGLRVVHVEAIGHHYPRTLRAWIQNLDANWNEVVNLIGVRRARAWRLYLAGASNSFAEGRLDVHQVVGIRP